MTETRTGNDLLILQLNRDHHNADRASDAGRLSRSLAADFIVQNAGVSRDREENLAYAIVSGA
jgi:hypothetical protein